MSRTQGAGKKIAVLEIGAGFNTPVCVRVCVLFTLIDNDHDQMVTRWPAESIARWHAHGSLVRINFDHSEVCSFAYLIAFLSLLF